MKSFSDVVAIVPAFNEESNIGEVVSRTRAFIRDVVVVDDGSSDRTSEIARSGGARVLRHPVNLGKGAALETGVDYVLKNLPSARYLVIIDADLQLKPEEAPSVVGPLLDGTADVVMGFRDFSSVPLRHRLGNFVWRTVFNLLFGTHLKDTNCGYMALSIGAMKSIGKLYGGYIIETQILAESVKKGLRIAQVPVTVDYHRASVVPRGIRVVLGVLLFIVKDGLNYRLRR